MKTVKRIESTTGDRALEFFVRPDGTYGFELLKYIEPEKAWITIGPATVSFTESLQEAEAEATSRFEEFF